MNFEPFLQSLWCRLTPTASSSPTAGDMSRLHGWAWRFCLEGLMLGFMSTCHYLKSLKFWTRGSVFSFWTGPCKFCTVSEPKHTFPRQSLNWWQCVNIWSKAIKLSEELSCSTWILFAHDLAYLPVQGQCQAQNKEELFLAQRNKTKSVSCVIPNTNAQTCKFDEVSTKTIRNCQCSSTGWYRSGVSKLWPWVWSGFPPVLWIKFYRNCRL